MVDGIETKTSPRCIKVQCLHLADLISADMAALLAMKHFIGLETSWGIYRAVFCHYFPL